jgi:hypothetical protein
MITANAAKVIIYLWRPMKFHKEIKFPIIVITILRKVITLLYILAYEDPKTYASSLHSSDFFVYICRNSKRKIYPIAPLWRIT